MNPTVEDGCNNAETAPLKTAAKTIADAWRVRVEKRKIELDDEVHALESIDEEIARMALAILHPARAAAWLIFEQPMNLRRPHDLTLGRMRTAIQVSKTASGKAEVLALLDKLSKCDPNPIALHPMQPFDY